MLRASALCVVIALLAPGPAAAQVIGADLRTSARSVPEAAAVGEDVSINATVTNTGPEPATNVALTLDLPEGLPLQAVIEAPGPCSGRRQVTCTVGTLAPGAAAQVRVLTGVTRKGSQIATALADAAEEDPNPANDQATAEVSASGSDCDRVGTVDGDELRAGKKGSVVCGLAGNDTLFGGPRGDELLGGTGDDSAVGDAGHDRIDGGEGTDACASDPGSGDERACELRVFALAGTLPLVELSKGTVGYGYHQSLFHTAISMRAFQEHVVMSDRGRGTGSTTAADIVVPSRDRVRSPVNGVVVKVTRYLLYCERPDWKVVIKPAIDPSLRVLVLHLGKPGVDTGDRLKAGTSPIGRARPQDWSDSQKNHYFPDRYPHVHVEVERDRASPTPGCLP